MDSKIFFLDGGFYGKDNNKIADERRSRKLLD